MKDIWQEINDNQKALESCLKTLRKNGEASALAERDYRVLKSQKILELKSQGYPVTIITDIVKGMPDVAELDLKRSIAEVTFKANIEAINIYKKKSDDLRITYEKEYSNDK